MLEISNIDIFYGKIQALWGVSLKIDEAELVALVGANGAGKTTLLHTSTTENYPTKPNIFQHGPCKWLMCNGLKMVGNRQFVD